jgi:hypothetical protein
MLAQDFVPFATIRFALSFFGWSKFEAALPKSVRGTFMQGARSPKTSLADGTALAVSPHPGSGRRARAVAARSAAGCVDLVSPASGRDCAIDGRLRIAPYELARMVHDGPARARLALGVAEDAGTMAVFAQARGEPAIEACLAYCEQRARRSALVTASAAFDVRARVLSKTARISDNETDGGWQPRAGARAASRASRTDGARRVAIARALRVRGRRQVARASLVRVRTLVASRWHR